MGTLLVGNDPARDVLGWEVGGMAGCGGPERVRKSVVRR